MVFSATRLQVAGLIFWINAIVMLCIGFAFVFATQFFPFHGDVIQIDWQDLDPSLQTLLLGMMRTEGAGYLASAVAMSILLLIPFRAKQRWAIWAVASVGLVEHFPTLLATWNVAHSTPASPPWMLVGMLMLSLLFALFLAVSEPKQMEEDHESTRTCPGA